MKCCKKENGLSVFKIIFLHLLPGIPVLPIAFIFSSPFFGIKFPMFISLLIAFTVCLVPIQWIILIIFARKDGETVKDIIGFKQKITKKIIVFWSLPCIIFAAIIFMVGTEIEGSFWTIFNWIPDWFRVNRYSLDVGKYLIPVVVLNFIIRGILLPFTEEIYFRGFLLPRMDKLGKVAPIISSALFSIYHFFTPWENISRTLAVLPFVYGVWYKKNLKIGIISHCAVNLLSCIGLVISIM